MNKNFVDDMLVEEEIRRVSPEMVQGELPTMILRDMKIWALKKGLLNSEPYNDLVVLHAQDRGWVQANFTGLEIL